MRFALSLVALLIPAAPAMAADDRAEPGIVVQGSGQASARPSVVELSGTVSGDAELAADAMVKFRDAKKKALAALTALKNPDLTVEPQGVTFGTSLDPNAAMMAMRGMPSTNTNSGCRLSETCRILLNNADKLEPDAMFDKLLKVLDTAKDAGFQFGAPPASNYWEMQMQSQNGTTTVNFELPDSAALREKAYKSAIEDAKQKAKSLAELSGVKLGRIISVREGQLAGGDNSQTIVNMYGIVNSKSDKSAQTLAGATSGELTLRVNLIVQFEIEK